MRVHFLDEERDSSAMRSHQRLYIFAPTQNTNFMGVQVDYFLDQSRGGVLLIYNTGNHNYYKQNTSEKH